MDIFGHLGVVLFQLLLGLELRTWDAISQNAKCEIDLH